MEKKATKRAMQAQKTKEKIYRCGVKLFREHGFEAVTVEQLAKAADTGHAGGARLSGRQPGF